MVYLDPIWDLLWEVYIGMLYPLGLDTAGILIWDPGIGSQETLQMGLLSIYKGYLIRYP